MIKVVSSGRMVRCSRVGWVRLFASGWWHGQGFSLKPKGGAAPGWEHEPWPDGKEPPSGRGREHLCSMTLQPAGGPICT